MTENALARLNALSPREAEAWLLECCGSRAWAHAVAARRPFPDAASLYDAADEMWRALPPSDWLEAFAAHPRIGESADRVEDAGAKRWSQGEQAGVDNADSRVRERLAAANAEYERRFGHIFIVCATGKSAEEMLGLLEARMTNEPGTESRIAAEEQRKIMQLRLRKMLES